MRHRKRGKHLGRTASHRKALWRNMTCSLFVRGQIRTTREKAREVRQFAERLVTLGKRGNLAAFRRALKLLGDKRVVQRLFREIAPRYAERPGGYTRMLKLGADRNRLGDNASQVILELVGEPMPSEKTEKPSRPKRAEQSADEPGETKEG